MNKITTLRFFLFLLLFTGSSAYAATTALSFTGTTALTAVSQGTFGWRFSVDKSINVTHLGFYDHENTLGSGNGDGLLEGHEVAIYKEGSTGTAEVNTTIPSGTTTLIENFFQYIKLATPTLLSAGEYRIGAFRLTSADAIIQQATSVSTAPDISYIAGVSSTNPLLAYPGTTPPSSFQDGFFGPNFKYDIVQTPAPGVPAPDALILIFSGLGFIGIRKKPTKLKA